MPRAIPVLLVLGMSLVACGEEAQQSTATSTTQTTAAPTTTTTSIPETTTTTAARLSEDSKLAFEGIGPLKVGMTLAEASAAAGQAVDVDPNYVLDNCAYAAASGGPKGLSFMVLRDAGSDPWRIVRFDVDDESRITTLSGIGIGATEAEVKSTYGAPGRTGKISIANHEYVEGGHYITYDDDGPAGLRMLFETDGQKVTRFRSGRQGPVGYVEGCA
jgi:hypothetical protein